MKDTGVYLSFPPTGVGLSRIEYQALTMDLPHLCLNEKILYNEKKEGDEVKYTIIKGDGVKEYSTSSLDKFQNKEYWPELNRDKYKNVTKLPEETRQIQFYNRKYNNLIKSDSWMCDETVSLLLNWIETIKDEDNTNMIRFPGLRQVMRPWNCGDACAYRGLPPESSGACAWSSPMGMLVARGFNQDLARCCPGFTPFR